MTRIDILLLPGSNGTPVYCATTGNRYSQGNTAGEALDALNAQIPAEQRSTMVVVQSFQPDEFFTSSQSQRLGELMSLNKAGQLTPDQQRELEHLVEAELIASAERTKAIAS